MSIFTKIPFDLSARQNQRSKSTRPFLSFFSPRKCREQMKCVCSYCNQSELRGLTACPYPPPCFGFVSYFSRKVKKPDIFSTFVLHCRSVWLPGVVVIPLVIALFHHFDYLLFLLENPVLVLARCLQRLDINQS